MDSPDPSTSTPEASNPPRRKILDLRGITKRFAGVRALGGVDLIFTPERSLLFLVKMARENPR